LVAGPLFAPWPLVVRVTVFVPIVTFAVALATNVSAKVELMVTVQVAVLPITVGAPHVVASVVGVGSTSGVISKATGEAPLGWACAVIVKTCGSPTALTSSGVICTEAST
jgi:hypothetical protein